MRRTRKVTQKRRRNTTRRNKKTTKRTTLKRKIGGGSSDVYCPCCGLPFYVSNDVDIRDSEWMENAIGFDTHNNILINLEDYDSYGGLYFSDEQTPEVQEIIEEIQENTGTDVFDANPIIVDGRIFEKDSDDMYGVVIHKDCVELIQQVIERELHPTDGLIIIRNAKPVKEEFNFQGQFFRWEEATDVMHYSFFASPLIHSTPTYFRVIDSLTDRLIRLLKQNKTPYKNVLNASRLPTINIPVNNVNNASNALNMSNLKNGNIVGLFPNNEGKIYGSQAIVAYRKGRQMMGWKKTLKTQKNPFTRKPIERPPVYRRARLVKESKESTETK